MKKESPICVEMVYLCSFSKEDEKQCGGKLCRLTFDERNDFLIDETFAGIAVKIEFTNKRPFTYDDKGVRRRVSLTLVDVTERCEAAVKHVRVSMPKGNPYKTVYESFPLSQTDFKAGHTYRLVVRDESSADIIDEQVLHIFVQDQLGHPTGWYTVDYCGIVRDGENALFRSLKSEDHKFINVRFDVRHAFGRHRPLIMPELELRIYYPDGERVEHRFAEPESVDPQGMLYRIESHLFTSSLYRGVFYAELLCMEYPIAGFVFSTNGPELAGGWYDEGATPLEEYSPAAAEERFQRLVCDDGGDADDKFEAALDRFIESEQKALGGLNETEKL